MKYVSMWGNAISIADRRPENYAKNLTLRYPIHPSFDGTKLRITLDNFCGNEVVTISEVYVACNKSNGSKEIDETTTIILNNNVINIEYNFSNNDYNILIFNKLEITGLLFIACFVIIIIGYIIFRSTFI